MNRIDTAAPLDISAADGRRLRLAVVVSHPIQHFVHFYRAIAADPAIDLTVFYCSRIGLERYFDSEFGADISWNADLLSGYRSVFLDEADAIASAGFRSVNNPSVGRHLDACKPDAVLLYGYAQITQLRAFGWARRRGVPILMTGDSELLQERASWRRALKRLALRSLFARVAAFLTVGDNNEGYYAHYGVPQARMFRSPFTIDEASFRRVRADRVAVRRAVRADIGAGEDDLVLLSVGKLSGRKRPGDIVAAARRLAARPEAKRVRFWLAGDGALRNELETVARNENLPIRFLGFINVDRLPDIYAAADVLVHPSERDPHPLVMSEAACTGLPAICSDRVGAVGPTDIVQPGENGLVYRCGDSEALGECVMRFAREPDLLPRMAAAGLAIFEQQSVAHSVAGLKQAVACSTGTQLNNSAIERA